MVECRNKETASCAAGRTKFFARICISSCASDSFSFCEWLTTNERISSNSWRIFSLVVALLAIRQGTKKTRSGDVF